MPNPLFTILTIAAVLTGCADVTCDEDSVEVTFARQLSESRLARLYDEVEKNRSKIRELRGVIPDDFADLNLVTIRDHDFQVHLRLKGCMDHHVDLVVLPKDRGHRIELKYGEGPTFGSEVLWSGGAT